MNNKKRKTKIHDIATKSIKVKRRHVFLKTNI